MFPRLNATNFSTATPWSDKYFQIILSKITRCYGMLIADKILVDNDENKIRDALYTGYLGDDKIRALVGFIDDGINFFREGSEDHSEGRVDILITSPNTTKIQKAYYVIECKRLDSKAVKGTSGLNQKYIDNGVQRFTSGYYSSYYGVNAMIGFVVDKLDIDSNTNNINGLLSTTPSIKTTKKITKDNFIDNFEYHYCSKHLTKNNGELKIYHLMYDFSQNLKPIYNDTSGVRKCGVVKNHVNN
jgi:hypothetical protein